MSPEVQVRNALLAHAPLLALMPAERISVDLVDADAPRPYIAFSKQGVQRDRSMSGQLLATITNIDVQCVGASRTNAIEVADLVVAALEAAGMPPDGGSAGYDPELDIEAEVVSVTVFD